MEVCPMSNADRKAIRVDDSEPTPGRQSELRAAYEKNIAKARAPYAGVRIKTRSELEWLMFERGWWQLSSEDGVPWEIANGADLSGADLSGFELSNASLVGANLKRSRLPGADLSGADLTHANLTGADLTGAVLFDATLTDANLLSANLTRADLRMSRLSHARLRYAHLNNANVSYVIQDAGVQVVEGEELDVGEVPIPADLSGADLTGATLFGADLAKADLSGADLSEARMDIVTVLTDVQFDGRTCFSDVVWNDVPLTRVSWDKISSLGDEWKARQPNDVNGKAKSSWQRGGEFASAARAYQLLAVALRAQGIDEHASRYAHRGRELERQALWRTRRYLPWASSTVLSWLSGDGYGLTHVFGTYATIVATFALLYLAFGLPKGHPAAWQRPIDALWVSVTAIHGRVFFESFAEYSKLAWIAAIESVCGIVVEAIFVAVLLQRMFNK
jgi:uncharacterized protein YjbI with pentapeptide repeats